MLGKRSCSDRCHNETSNQKLAKRTLSERVAFRQQAELFPVKLYYAMVNRTSQFSAISGIPFRRGFRSRAQLLVQGFRCPLVRRDLDFREIHIPLANLVPRLLFLLVPCGRSL